MSYRIYLEKAMETKMSNAPKSNDELELVIKEDYEKIMSGKLQ